MRTVSGEREGMEHHVEGSGKSVSGCIHKCGQSIDLLQCLVTSKAALDIFEYDTCVVEYHFRLG